jgi:hypothetical protein
MKPSVQNYYGSETHHHEGVDYAVLDAKKLYADHEHFSDQFSTAVRCEPVFVWRPKAGDVIKLSNGSKVEASGNETVFIKKLDPSGTQLKIYIPSGTGGALPEATLDEKYQPELAYFPRNPEADPVLHVLPAAATVTRRAPKPTPVPILHEVIEKPTVILNARGTKNHQYMVAGDSLKFEDGDCLPLPKAELDTAWQVSQRGVETGIRR